MKKNAFAIGLLVATILIGASLIVFGIMQGKRYQAAQEEYEEMKGDVEKMARVRPFPTQRNLDERQEEVNAFRGQVDKLQKSLQAFRPEEFEKISPSEFQNRLVAKSSAIKELFEEKGEQSISYPEQFALGFESYVSGLADPKATGKLNYQLEAMSWLFEELAKLEVYEVRNVVREKFPAESGKDWTLKYTKERKPVPLAQSLPIELVFFAEEKSVNEFINKVVSSDKYFFAVDMVRASNENLNAPVRSQAGLEEEVEEDDDIGGGFTFGEEEESEEEESAVDSGKILGQVLGKEAVYAGLQLRLLLFQEPIALPEFN